MRRKYILIAILILAAVLRLAYLSRGDTINDEVFYAFRAIGLLDFDEAAQQKTPLEWNNPYIPWWTKLSFHDHPPLVFWVQHFFIKIFGENNFSFRFPSAILGILSVYLLYLIGRQLFSREAGLLGALFLAVTLSGVYISRTGMQEPYVIFFLLLASYFFLKSFKKDSYLIWTAVALGFGLLAKYNTFVLIPIFLTYSLLYRRDFFKNKKFWMGAGLIILICSPIIIYNIALYRNVGHFDFQLSYIFHQNHPEWTVQPGKETGSISDRLHQFVPRLINSNSWLFLILVAVSLAAFFGTCLKKGRIFFRRFAFLFWSIFYLAALIIFGIGPSYRFLSILAPFFSLCIGIFFWFLYQKYLSGRKKIAIALLLMFVGFEIFYSVNNQIRYYPAGITPWFSSKVRYENYNWGYNDLDAYLNKEFAGKIPALTFDVQYKFLDDLRNQALDEGIKNGLEPWPFLIVCGENFDNGAKLWVMERRFVYRAWPILRLEDYFKYRKEQGGDYFDRSGFAYQYYIMPVNFVIPPEVAEIIRGVKPVVIQNPRGENAFLIYKLIK